MSPDQARQRIAELRAEVARHDELYYRRARPEITDFDYDRLKAELAALEARFPAEASAAGAETPTRRVGDDRAEGFVRARHRLAMTTLDNTYDEAELREFHARLVKALGVEDLAYTVEPKIDGVAVSLTYEQGRLTLQTVVERVQPTVLIGTSTVAGAFNQSVVQSMARTCERPDPEIGRAHV